MDDANQPALLSIDYFGYKSKHDPEGKITSNTRRFILSSKNPYYYEGSTAKGIGSIHTPARNIWPMSIIMQGLTSTDTTEIMYAIETLQKTDANTDLMHESFNADNPGSFTRHWFSWANSLFSELILRHEDLIVSEAKNKSKK